MVESPISWQPDPDQVMAASLLTHELGAELIEALSMLEVSNKKGD